MIRYRLHHGWSEAEAVTEPIGSRRKFPKRFYSVYEPGTDELLVCGTSAECAAALGIQIPTFYQYISRRRPYEIFSDDYENEEAFE